MVSWDVTPDFTASQSIRNSFNIKFSNRNSFAVICFYAPLITWTLRAVDHKHLECFEMWCCRRMEKISWADYVRNEVLLRVKEQRSILHEISKRKANWIGHILRRNCLLQRVIEGKVRGG